MILDKIGMASTVVIGVTETMDPITAWEKYLQGGALTVVSVLLVIFALKVFPMLINKLTEQSKAFADAQESAAKSNSEGQKAMAEAINRLSNTCVLAQSRHEK